MLPVCKHVLGKLYNTCPGENFLIFNRVALLVPRLLTVLVEHEFEVTSIVFWSCIVVIIDGHKAILTKITGLHLVNKVEELRTLHVGILGLLACQLLAPFAD